jgi:radical SAM enzyme (TIGR01210 family)
MAVKADQKLRRTLIRANREVRSGRPPFPTDVNVAVHKFPTWIGSPRRPVEMTQFWFRTRGCTFDRAGQCSMCNYGIGDEIDIDEVGTSVERILSRVRKGSFIYLSPSGSLLDDREVPAALRERLLACVAKREPTRFVFETRPETCTPERLDRVKEMLPDTTTLVCQLGLESWDPDVRSLCHLKPATQEPYVTVLGRLRERHYESIANLTLGGLGLSTREAYEDTLTSVRGAREAGFTTKIVFPLSAKSGTLLGWAHDRGLWNPVPLWVLVLLLAAAAQDRPGPDGAGDLGVSWFNPQIDDVVKSRPDGCDVCRPHLVDVLNRFRQSPEQRVLDDGLDWRGCGCLAQAIELLATDHHRRYPDRLAEIAERWEYERRDAGDREPLPLL